MTLHSPVEFYQCFEGMCFLGHIPLKLLSFFYYTAWRHIWEDADLRGCVVQFPQFQTTSAHNCHLIHSNIFKNIKCLHVADLTCPSSGSILTL